MLLAVSRNDCYRVMNRDEALAMGTLLTLKTRFVTRILDDRDFAAHFHASRRGEGRYGPAKTGS